MYQKFLVILIAAAFIFVPTSSVAMRVFSTDGQQATGKIHFSLEIVPIVMLTIEPSVKVEHNMVVSSQPGLFVDTMNIDVGRVDVFCIHVPENGYCVPWENGEGATMVFTFDTTVAYSGSKSAHVSVSRVETRGRLLGDVRYADFVVPPEQRNFRRNGTVLDSNATNTSKRVSNMDKSSHQIEVDILSEDYGMRNFEVYYTVTLNP